MGTKLATGPTPMTIFWGILWLRMGTLMTADTPSMTTNMLYILKALSHQTDQGFFWWHGVLILLASRKRWSTQPLLTASKRPLPVFKKSSRLMAPTKLNKALLKTC